MPRLHGLALSFAVLALLRAGDARGQGSCQPPEARLAAPVELGDGLTAPAPSGTPTPFAAAARAAVTVAPDCGRRFRAGPAGAIGYRQGSWSGLGGATVSVRVADLTGGGILAVPVTVAAEGLWGSRGRASIGGAATVEPLRAIRVTLRVHRERDLGATLIELAVGTNLARWLSPPRGTRVTERRDPCAGPPVGRFDPYFCAVTTRTSTSIPWLSDTTAEATAVRASIRSTLQPAESQTSVQSLLDLLRQRAGARVADAVAAALASAQRGSRAEGHPVPDMDAAAERRTVEAIVRGLRLDVEDRPRP